MHHYINVMLFSMVYAHKNDLNKYELALYGQIGLLHDIGYANIPEEKILYPKKLTEEEKTDIIKHPRNGMKMLKECKVDERVAQVAWEHHERLNGTGYPRGKKANDIGIYTRIISMIDTFEKLISHRPPKSPHSVVNAML